MKTDQLIQKIFFYLIGVIFIAGFFFIFAYSIKNVVPAENKELVSGIIEVLKAGVYIILGYFYGSSKGSADKTEMLKKP